MTPEIGSAVLMNRIHFENELLKFSWDPSIIGVQWETILWEISWLEFYRGSFNIRNKSENSTWTHFL